MSAKSFILRSLEGHSYYYHPTRAYLHQRPYIRLPLEH